MTTMVLTSEQDRARVGIREDLNRGMKEVTLGGYAGTGKTTMINSLLDIFPSFHTCAFTGKAAEILRRKGIEANTIHSTIYRPVPDTDPVLFELNEEFDTAGFIVDEASMVSEGIYKDLMSFRRPCIFVGDHGQLEPVASKFNLMQKPRYTLETIHRNSGDIAKFAQHLRQGLPALQFKCEDGSVEFVKDPDVYLMCEVDQIICAYNRERVQINAEVRESKNYYRPLHNGEKVICLQNNRKQALFNGQQGVVTGTSVDKRGRPTMDFVANGVTFYDVRYDPCALGREKPPKFDPKNKANPFDYAYCITCHKAQGDEMNEVLVMEPKPTQLWDHKRWTYTAASRARTKLYWCAEG